MRVTGLDVHGGLRIMFDGPVPLLSKEPGVVSPARDVEAYVVRLRERIEFAERWLAAWHGVPCIAAALTALTAALATEKQT